MWFPLQSQTSDGGGQENNGPSEVCKQRANADPKVNATTINLHAENGQSAVLLNQVVSNESHFHVFQEKFDKKEMKTLKTKTQNL